MENGTNLKSFGHVSPASSKASRISLIGPLYAD